MLAHASEVASSAVSHLVSTYMSYIYIWCACRISAPDAHQELIPQTCKQNQRRAMDRVMLALALAASLHCAPAACQLLISPLEKGQSWVGHEPSFLHKRLLSHASRLASCNN